MESRGKGFEHLTSIKESLTIIERYFSKIIIDDELVSLNEAYGRVLYEDIIAPIDVPGFDRAAMDGYAVKAEDTFGASSSNPIDFKIVGSMDIIGLGKVKVEQGETVEVVTGSPITEGANAVVMLEHTSCKRDIVEVYSSVHPSQNVTKKGEDIRIGEIVLNKGMQLTPYDLGILKIMGFNYVKVYQKPKVAVASTGDELVETTRNKTSFKIIDVNSVILSTLVQEVGAHALNLGISKDNIESLQSIILKGLDSANIMIISGGSSVGLHDLLPKALEKLGGELLFHGVAMRPGMPAGLGKLNDRFVFMLPGNPVAAILAFRVLVGPTIDILLQRKREEQTFVFAKLTRGIVSPPGIRSIIRVKVERLTDGALIVQPIRVSGSSILSSMVRANGIIEVPESYEGYEEGTIVKVNLFKPIIE